MARELSWYLSELRKKRTPGTDLNNSFNNMYDALSKLDKAIKKNDLKDEDKNREIIDQYSSSIQAVQRYLDERATSFFGPSSWETGTGLIGDLFQDLSAQFPVMRDMSASQTRKRNQYQQFRIDHQEDVNEDIFDSYGLTYDAHLNVPQEFKNELQVGSISTGRRVRLSLEQENALIDDHFAPALDMVVRNRLSNYVKGRMVEDHGYFSYGGKDPKEAGEAAEKKEKLRKALEDLAEKIYEEPALQEFTDDSPEAREQFASGIQVPANQRYNSIETNREFLDLTAKADPFERSEQDSRIFRQAVFDMVTAHARIRKDAQRHPAGTEEPEECAAAASRLAGSLGAGVRVEQVVRVRGNGRDGKNVYLKTVVPGRKPSGPNLISPEQFAGEGAVLDSGELARQLSEIQVVRYLAGNSGRGVEDLRFAFSDGEPKKITGITDVNMGGAFSDDPAAETMTPDSLTVMSRSTADRIMTISPERLGAILGSRIGGRALENAKTRLADLQQAIQESLDRKWAMDESLLPGKLHVIDDSTFSRLSIKQIASVQDNNGIKGLFSKTYSGMILKGAQAAEENAAYPGGLYQRQLNVLMESQGDKESSPEFVNALKAVKALNTGINRFMQANRELTAEELSTLRKTYTESIVEVNKYVRATRGWHWTTRGDVRHNAMAAMQGYMEQELKALNEYAPEHHWKLEKIIQHGRQEEIPVIEGDIQRVGGNMSSRQVLTINGRQGVFTTRKDYRSPTAQQMADVLIHNEYVIPEDIRYEVLDAGLAVWEKLNTIGQDHAEALLEKDVAETYEKAGAGFLNREDVKALNKLFKDKNIPQLTNDQSERSRNYRRHIAERIRAAMLLRNEKRIMKSAGIAEGRNIDQRNTAMSVMSDLLEMPNAAARARDVTVVAAGVEQSGTFQEWAEGNVMGNQVKTLDSDFCRYNSNAMTKEALQQLSDMQALDFICGNIDRHMDNMTFKFAEIDGEHRLVKITGIDNDLSFGTIKMSDYDNAQTDGRFMFPQHMLMMKQSTANAILNLSKDALEIALRPYIHGEDELEACWDRVQGLQKQLWDDLSYRFIGKNTLTDGHIRIFKDDDPVWDSFRPGDLANSRTLMGQFSKFAQIAENTKRHRLDNLPDDYELKKSVMKGMELTYYYRKLDAHPMLEVTNVNIVDSVIAQRGKTAEEVAGYFRDMKNVTMNETGAVTHEEVTRFGKDMFREAEKTLRSMLPNEDLDNIREHEVIKEAGYRTAIDFFYIDGVPAEKYLRENYPRLFGSQALSAMVTWKQDDYVRGMLGAIMTSGRHHIDMVIPAMDDRGRFTASITELKMNLEPLEGTEGLFGTTRTSRQQKLLEDGTREMRFKEIERKVVFRMEQGARQYRQKVLDQKEGPLDQKYRNVLQPAPQANQPQAVAPQANQPQAAPQAAPQPVAPQPVAPQGDQEQKKAGHNSQSFRKEKLSLKELIPEKPEKKNATAAKEKVPGKVLQKEKDPGKAPQKGK